MTSVSPLVLLFKNVFFIIVGLAGIGLLITIHELGHFIFAKLFSVSTPSFSIGFGPRIIQKKIGHTNFVLSAIPLGGYVEMAGSAELGQGEQKEAARTDYYSFAAKPYYQKFLIMIGGILFNLLFAYITLTALFAAGVPQTPLLHPKNAIPTLETVAPGGAAQRAGLQAGDTIIDLRTPSGITHITSYEQLITELEPLAGIPITLRIQRDSSQRDIEITPDAYQQGPKKVGRLGAYFKHVDLPPRPWRQAVRDGISATHTLIKQTFLAFKSIFSQRSLEGVGGPLMVISQTIKGAEHGLKLFLLLLAFISVNLAVLNIIPLPIMDGGQILFYSIEALTGRPLPEQIKMYIYYASWAFIIALALYLSVKDVYRMTGSFFK